jgi:hypothetical protein
MTVIPIEKDVVGGPGPIEVLARVAAQLGGSDRAIAALQKLLSTPYEGPLASRLPLTPARSNVRSAPERSALPRIDISTYPKTSLSDKAARVVSAAASRL